VLNPVALKMGHRAVVKPNRYVDHEDAPRSLEGLEQVLKLA
jgi:hypothetical protein